MSKYLVYTCVTRDYDKIRKVLAKQDPNIDFVCFTDKVNQQMDLRPQTGWIFLPIPSELRRLDSRRQARMIKIGIYKYMKGYTGYLWIDAPIIVIGNLGKFFREHPFSANRNMYVSKHYMRDCVYQEFAQVLRLNKDRSASVYNQYERYKNMGYPQHNGMAETSILYRNLADLKVQNHAVMWADEILNYSYRDQLSFNWTAWAGKTPITYLTEDIYKRDTENEKSEYFFLPWPKHNNPNVIAQLEARLRKTPNKDTNIKIDYAPIPAAKSKSEPSKPVDTFEKEYQEFLDNLKKKKIQKEAAEKVKLAETKSVEKPVVQKEEPKVEQIVETPVVEIKEEVKEKPVVSETIDNSVQTETVVEPQPQQPVEKTEISNTKTEGPKPLEKKKKRKYTRRKK